MELAEYEEIQQVFFMLFLLKYLITVLGNAGIILIIHLDLELCNPMYYFLSYLSLLDLSNSTVITPKPLENLLTSNKYISFMGCFTQKHFFVFLGATEYFLLSSMAYYHYVAICKPLRYQVVMSRRGCQVLITESYMISFTDSLVNILCMNTLNLCKSNVKYHFFCDTTPILSMSCTDTNASEIRITILTGPNVMVSLITISVSYGSILPTILKIKSTSGKHKAFSTCASHFLGVMIFYSTTIFTYLKLQKSYFLGKDQVASVFYPMVIPMLNPFFYSLKNKVKNAFIRAMQKREGSKQLK